jgi:uncharacterized membrane protein YadS
VAAGYTFSNAAGDLAVIVKLTRTLMIVPVTLVLALYTTRKSASAGPVPSGYRIAKIFPWFVIGFLAASVMNTFFPIPSGVTRFLSSAGKFVIVMAMASIGLNTNLSSLLKNGTKPILLGFICWVVLSLVSVVAQSVIVRFRTIPTDRPNAVPKI